MYFLKYRLKTYLRLKKSSHYREKYHLNKVVNVLKYYKINENKSNMNVLIKRYRKNILIHRTVPVEFMLNLLKKNILQARPNYYFI